MLDKERAKDTYCEQIDGTIPGPIGKQRCHCYSKLHAFDEHYQVEGSRLTGVKSYRSTFQKPTRKEQLGGC